MEHEEEQKMLSEMPEPAGIAALDIRKRIGIVALCIILILVSCFPVTQKAVAKTSFQDTKISLEEKKDTVLKMTAACAATATVVAAVPGDASTPIANEIMDLSSYFVMILAAIYLEKFLLVVMGYVSFRFLIPVGLAALAIFILTGWQTLRKLAVKLMVLGILLFAVIPVSVQVSNIVEANFGDSISDVLDSAEVIAESEIEAEEETEAEEDTEAAEEIDAQDDAEEEIGLWDRIKEFVSDTADTVTDTAESLTDGVSDFVNEKLAAAQDALNEFIEAIAIMIVTSCLIPILILIFFIWILRVIAGIDVPAFNPGALKGKVRFKGKKKK